MTLTEHPAAPRLTRLELQGFKSFANRTVFVFEPGITAVIGPNGSGKSNISDGVRWVLGEQSHSLLRSKKTEDVIFAGGQGKAAAGMAEVSVTFDNSTSWLPIEFAEVTVTRRAYRSGENQFLINGRKVRLKDVHQLTASLGHSHTVVGQGLVDTALSQRAEERRSLFEHAADLTGLQLKANEATRNLTEAENNANRIRDLLREVEPRLKTLERAAVQAREWQGVHDRLKELERGYFTIVLTDALERETEAESATVRDQEAATRLQAESESLQQTLHHAKIASEQAQAEWSRLDTEVQTLTDQIRRIGHERDLAQERLRALQRRQEDMNETQSGLDKQEASVRESLVVIEQELGSVEQAYERARRTLERTRETLKGQRDAQMARERQAASLTSAATSLERQLQDGVRKRALTDQRLETGGRERQRSASQVAELDGRLAGLETQVLELDGSRETMTVELRALVESASAARSRLVALAETEKAEQGRLSAIEREIAESEAHLTALRRINESGAGLYAGVRAVLAAGQKGELSGIRGTVAELIRVPGTFDTAIEVALGSHLQDIVVADWSDAERAIEMLKRGKTGRATFQPISSIRGGRDLDLPAALRNRPGVHGRASDLVGYDADLQRIVQALLGRYLVVDDLHVARSLLAELTGGWSMVTLTGEIARSGGSVTGGAAVRESGMLSRERELRDLPETIRERRETLAAAVSVFQSSAAVRTELAAELRALEEREVVLKTTRAGQEQQQTRLAGWLQEVRTERERVVTMQSTLASSDTAAADEIAALELEETRLLADLERTQLAQADLLETQQVDREALLAVDTQVREGEQELAGLEERLRFERRQKASLQSQLATLREEIAQRSDRFAVLHAEIEGISGQVARLEQEGDGLADQLGLAERQLPPLRQALDASRLELTELERKLESTRQGMIAAERALGGSELHLERVRGDLIGIRQRIEDDLELENPDALLTMAAELDLATDEAEREISRLKERLRRVGYVGEEAVAEFERESAHFAFLREQLTDVDGASLRFHEMLEDLRQTMQERFDATFEQVAEAFSEAFTTLFGGGTARLVMVSNDEGEGSGVDIVAQPPGKRLQSLALLSGGERALTAVALLFAILKVNPTPFVLLDEVDAALDEANVVRFREMLQGLASETQAVIITHNRGTVEVADSLYGVSMRADGVSTVLSMRLKEPEVAV